MEHSLRSAVIAVFRPLARYLIRHGVTYPGLAQVLKEVYVEQAVRLAHEDSGTVTASRVALLSGVHRKEVARLRGQSNAPVRASKAASVAARVVAEWISRADFVDEQGQPRPLPLKAGRDALSFETLVRLVKADLRANIVLEELMRVGVTVREGGMVRLMRTAYVSDFPHEKLQFLGDNVGDHIASATHNLVDGSAPFIERAVYYDSIPSETLRTLRPGLFRMADHFLRNANQAIMPFDDDSSMMHRSRVRIGVYYYEDDSKPGTEEEHDDH